MIARIRTRAVWLAVGLTFGGGLFAFAGVTNVGAVDDIPSVAETKRHHGQQTQVEATETPDTNETTEVETTGEENGGERKLNHGFYVSEAAHCEDVEDTENEVSFTAPEDCDTDGKAHGEYVRSVAKSDAGKGPKDHGGEGS